MGINRSYEERKGGEKETKGDRNDGSMRVVEIKKWTEVKMREMRVEVGRRIGRKAAEVTVRRVG